MGINPRAFSVETDLAALDPRQPGIQKMQGIVRFSHLNSANSAGLASGEQHPLALNAINGQKPLAPFLRGEGFGVRGGYCGIDAKNHWPLNTAKSVILRSKPNPVRDATLFPSTCIIMELMKFGLEIQTGSANLRNHFQRLPNRVSAKFLFFVGQVGQVGRVGVKKP